jgi:hypothetical protein
MLMSSQAAVLQRLQGALAAVRVEELNSASTAALCHLFSLILQLSSPFTAARHNDSAGRRYWRKE